MTESTHHGVPRALVPRAIAVLALFYLIALVAGWPQYGTQALESQQAQHGEAADHAGDDAAAIVAPPLWTVLPFVLMLAAIAVLPLIPATQHWWESNLSKFMVATALAVAGVGFFAVLPDPPLEGHWPAHHLVEPASGAMQTGFVRAILENAVMQEYVPFIVLLFSLYTISGGIRIEGDLQADPLTNAAFMAGGAPLARFIGPTRGGPRR